MRRIKITLAYDGTQYHGWQVQPALTTIQGTLQDVLAEIEGHPIHVEGSGRTDAGVHALAQAAAFSLDNPIPLENLQRAMNRLLPRDIRVLSAEERDAGFNPRYDARAKTYEYRIFRGPVCSPFERCYVYHYPFPLDLVRLLDAAPLFEGQHDFSAFAAADDRDAEGRSKVRTVFSSRAQLAGDRLVYRVRGSGFLKHMVRNLVGTLLEIGKGNLAPTDFESLACGPTAPARGLFLVDVEY